MCKVEQKEKKETQNTIGLKKSQKMNKEKYDALSHTKTSMNAVVNKKVMLPNCVLDVPKEDCGMQLKRRMCHRFSIKLKIKNISLNR